MWMSAHSQVQNNINSAAPKPTSMCYATGLKIVCSIKKLLRDSTSKIAVKAIVLTSLSNCRYLRTEQLQNNTKVSSVWTIVVKLVQKLRDMLASWMKWIAERSDDMQDLKLLIVRFQLTGDYNLNRHVALITETQVRKYSTQKEGFSLLVVPCKPESGERSEAELMQNFVLPVFQKVVKVDGMISSGTVLSQCFCRHTNIIWDRSIMLRVMKLR